MSALPAADNRRQFRRIPFDGEVRLYSDRAMWAARLIDISLRGALVDRPDGWEGQSGKRQRLDLRVASGLIISVAALIAHVSPRFIGYRFDKIDLDSFVRLKRLVELNLGDAEMLNRELGSLGR